MKKFSSDEVLQELMNGNKRYVAAQFAHPNQTVERRVEVAKKQHPFAIVLGCSDSRVPPEIIFDQGLGDLFVIRVAGNVVDDVVIGSIEYAAEHFNAPLIMVLGHKRCGAVEATINGGEAPGRIGSLVEAIKPAVEKAKSQLGFLLDNAVKVNISMVVDRLKSSQPILANLIREGRLKIVGAHYDLDTGVVNIIS
jgi:carbonic anhydrase